MLRNKWIGLVFASLLTLGMLTGCGGEAKNNSAKEAAVQSSTQTSSEGSGQAATPAGALKFTHAWGETELAGPAKKVVTLDFSFIDTMVALGVMPVGNAGVSESRIPEYLQDQITSDVVDVGERKAPNLEVIESVGPDLILASQDRHNMIKNELQDIAPTVALDDNSYDEILSNMDLIAKAVGKEEEAAKIRVELEKKVAEAKQQITGSPKVLVVGLFDDEFAVWLKDSFVGSLLTDIGVDYPLQGEKSEVEGKGEVLNMTLERLSEINPDYIFIYGDDLDKYKDNPLFKQMTAVKEQHMIRVDRNIWSRGRGPIAANKILDESISLLTGKSVQK